MAGFAKVRLATARSQRAARALYRKLGWLEGHVYDDGAIAMQTMELDVANARW